MFALKNSRLLALSGLGKTACISVALFKFNLYTMAGNISVMFGKATFALRGPPVLTSILGDSRIFFRVSGFCHQ